MTWTPAPSQPAPQTFHLFNKLPPEIQLEIISQCNQNDLICLSLTSHSFRTAMLPLIPPKPPLKSVDQLAATRHAPQPTSPNICSCSPAVPSTCKVSYDPYSHRRRRHTYAHPAPCFSCSFYPTDHAACTRPRCKRHCVCISCPLYVRLREWMGPNLRYCSKCNMFTERNKRKNGGRCTHGRRRGRRTPNNHWTATKGRSYGYRWWRKWGTSGIDRGAYEPKAVAVR